jgi:hypothetical protein
MMDAQMLAGGGGGRGGGVVVALLSMLGLAVCAVLVQLTRKTLAAQQVGAITGCCWL